jgi:Cys-tRNA(Pro)/Cys-tRNA(Cys) deacylase
MHANVARALEKGPENYRVHDHADYAPVASPQDFADALNYPISRISKTLFVRTPSRDAYALIVCRIDKKVDFAKIGAA